VEPILMSSSTVPEEASAVLREWLGEGWAIEPLAGDASVRAYYRVRGPGQSYMLAFYPGEVREQLRRFLDAYQLVSPHSRVPEVVRSSDCAVLQRDVGDRTLFDLLHADRDEGLRRYREAIDLLLGFQRAAGNEINPPFTAGFFLAEMDMSREYYAEKLMGVEPAVHGQNIHIINDLLYLLDYQDLRLGPDTYDLASLLRDRGVARLIGDEAELELIEYYAARCGSPEGIRRRYFEALLQRSIKILGTYSKQPIARGRLHYLEFIPPTLESLRRCLDELPEFAAISDLLPMEFSMDEARRRVEAMKEI
jgi:hypothetical protein